MNMALDDFQDDQKTLQDYIRMVQRRWRYILYPAVVIFMISLVVAFSLPAKYRSTATILIEEQEIPRDLVRSTITSYAAQQVQVISQRIMTVDNVVQIADKFGLFVQEDGTKMPSTEQVRLFAQGMNMDLVSADVIDPRSGRPTEATIAFTLSYENPNPSTAQKVTNELVTFYLNENLRSRAIKAQSTAQFLTAEADQLSEELVDIETSLATFKEQNKGSLPELAQYNLSTLDRSERELINIVENVKELERRKIELSAQRAQISPTAPSVLATGELVLSDAEHLKAIRSEYEQKASQYKDNHPDIVRLKREIKELEKSAGKATASRSEVNNPAYVLIDTQIKTIESDIRGLYAKREKLSEKIEEYRVLILKSPQVEKEYQALQRDYESARMKYREIKAKQREAGLAESLEQERKGERFSLVEPATLPLKPVSPNRPAIVLLGFILAGAAGLGLALVLEAIDPGVRGERAVEQIIGEPVMAVIPYLETEADKQLNKQRTKWAVGALVGLVVLLVVYIHFLIKPLDVIWFVVLQRLGLS